MFVPGFVLGCWAVSAPGCAGARSAEPAPTPAPAPAPAAPVTSGGASPAEPSGEDLVAFSVLADRATLMPGQPVTLAARFDIEPGWHIYWENPGESGLATEVTFAAPEGFEVGAVRYPGPVAFTSPGPVVSYGYAGTVLLSAVVEVPASAQGSATFEADAFWLACRDTCVRGQGKAALTLPVLAPGSEPPPPAPEAALLSEHEARLPRPWPAEARHDWEPGPDGPVLVVRVPVQLARGAKLAFFPSPDDQLAVTGQAHAAGAADMILRVRYRADAVPARVRGVLGAGDIFYRIDVPGPAAGN